MCVVKSDPRTVVVETRCARRRTRFHPDVRHLAYDSRDLSATEHGSPDLRWKMETSFPRFQPFPVSSNHPSRIPASILPILDNLLRKGNRGTIRKTWLEGIERLITIISGRKVESVVTNRDVHLSQPGWLTERVLYRRLTRYLPRWQATARTRRATRDTYLRTLVPSPPPFLSFLARGR